MKTKKSATAKRKENAQLRLEFAARLNEALDDKKIPPKGDGRQYAVAKLFNVTQTGVRRWLEGMAIPREGQFLEIAAKLDVRPDWLRYGTLPKRDDELRVVPPKTGTPKQQLADVANQVAKQLNLSKKDKEYLLAILIKNIPPN